MKLFKHKWGSKLVVSAKDVKRKPSDIVIDKSSDLWYNGPYSTYIKQLTVDISYYRTRRILYKSYRGMVLGDLLAHAANGDFNQWTKRREMHAWVLQHVVTDMFVGSKGWVDTTEAAVVAITDNQSTVRGYILKRTMLPDSKQLKRRRCDAA